MSIDNILGTVSNSLTRSNKTDQHKNERQVTQMSTTTLYGYTVSAPKRMIKQIKKDMLDDYIINFPLYSLGNMFYTDNGDYQVSMVDHKNKIIWFAHPYMTAVE